MNTNHTVSIDRLQAFCTEALTHEGMEPVSYTHLNLDGGNYEMWAAALGGGCFRLRLHRGCVSDDCMAVYRVLAAFMEELDAFGRRRREELDRNPFYRGTATAQSAFREMCIRDRIWTAPAP